MSRKNKIKKKIVQVDKRTWIEVPITKPDKQAIEEYQEKIEFYHGAKKGSKKSF